VDPDFHDYFEAESRQLREGGGLGRWASLRGAEVPQEVGEAVEYAVQTARLRAEEQGLRLRGDTELLLVFLAEELVARPVVLVGGEPIAEVREDLAADVRVVVDEVANSNEADDGELSAHALINGLSRSWDGLRSGRYRLWDRHREDGGGSPGGASRPRPPAGPNPEPRVRSEDLCGYPARELRLHDEGKDETLPA
jgi:hypothetical protein